MNKWLTHKRLFYGIATFLLFFMLFWAPHAPVNIDEVLHNKQANFVVDWYQTLGADNNCLVNRPDNLRYYGQAADNLAATINELFYIDNEYETRHYLGAVLSWCLLILTGFFIKKLTGSYLMGMLGMLLLFFSPRPFGQSFGNLKDLPFALGYLWTVYGIIRFIKELPYPSVKSTFLLASGIAFTNSIRIGGLVLYFYLGLFMLMWYLQNRKSIEPRWLLTQHKYHYLLLLTILVVIGYLGGLLFWPYGLQNPIVNPIKALSLMSHYAISIRQIFEGEFYWSTHLPWYYLPKWLIISIPEVVWLLFVVAIVTILKNRSSRRKNEEKLSVSILAFSFLFPFLYVILIDANLYSGWRQLYFIYPPLLVYSCYGFYQFWLLLKQKRLKIATSVAVGLLFMLPVVHTIKTYPNQYIYFNDLSKTINNPWSNYEYDYYFHGIKEASDWLFENEDIPKGSIVGSNFALNSYLPQNKNFEFQYIHFYEYSMKDWDYAILSNNYVHPDQLKNDSWIPASTIKTFYYDGNPYVVVLKRQSKESLTGKNAYEKGFFYKAASHFEKELDADPNNTHLMVYLASCYLESEKYQDVDKLIKRGLTIHPECEPLIYLKAKSEFSQLRYKEAITHLKALININAKYDKAWLLLANCYERTGEDEKARHIHRMLN